MNLKKIVIVVGVAALVAVLAYFVWQNNQSDEIAGFVKGNGRIEATEIDIAAKAGGLLQEVYVKEGEFVKAGQVVAKIKSTTMEAQLREAQAQLAQAQNAIATTEAQVAQRQSEELAMQAVVAQRQSELSAAQHRLSRSSVLAQEGAASKQQLDDDKAGVQGAMATLAAAKAQVQSTKAGVKAVQTQVVGAKSQVAAMQATLERIESELEDTELKAPRDGRVQYLVAHTGEMVAAGGKVMNVVDLSDVFMTFFIPETLVGQVALGSDVRLVLDALPNYAVVAKVSHVADVAQFTPKTVETQSERQKLMFKVKAKIAPELLQRHLAQVKTGLPGVAWVQLDRNAAWPAQLGNKVP